MKIDITEMITEGVCCHHVLLRAVSSPSRLSYDATKSHHVFAKPKVIAWLEDLRQILLAVREEAAKKSKSDFLGGQHETSQTYTLLHLPPAQK